MTAEVAERPAGTAGGGGVPARRAVIRWAWRLLRREWHQQLLILTLVVFAVGATVVGSAVAVNTPPSPEATFGTAQDLAVLPGRDPGAASQIAVLRRRFGAVEVIENQTVAVPGSVQTFDLRAQEPRGLFGQPLLALLRGRYPAGPGQVALTRQVASELHLAVGGVWRQGGTARRVTGIVENPQDLVDQFALVEPGQVTAPTQVRVLFDAPGASPASLGLLAPAVQIRGQATANVINPETISVAAVTLGMLLIALVGVGGFTVLAQRRLRALGMLAAIGATDRSIRLVIRANGAATGGVGAAIGGVLGLAAWLAYRPRLQASAHHVIGVLALPWPVIAAAMGLAVAATYLAASRPARAVARIPVAAALSGRPAPPKPTRRWAAPAGFVLLVVAFIAVGKAGSSVEGGNAMPVLVAGLVALTAALILLSPLCLQGMARLAGRAPVTVRLALRDLSRYRARSGAALGAIGLAIFIAVLTCVASAARYGNVLDYTGPNLAPGQVAVHISGGPAGLIKPGGPGPAGPASPRAEAAATRRIAAALGAREVIELRTADATLQRAAAGRNWYGPIYVATPQLLGAFGIKGSQVNPSADILTMRPGLTSITKMQLVYGDYFNGPGPTRGPAGPVAFPCPRDGCLANPPMQEVSALPSGTSAPNTVLTEHAVRALGLRTSVSGWLIQTARPPTASQISAAQSAAAAAGLLVETRSSIPSLTEITGWATGAGIALALAILAMSIGLIRSETARDLRSLAAAGAGGAMRRTLAAATGGVLALVGAVMGTAAGYLAAVAFFRANALDGLSSLSSVPVADLLIILIGMPLAAAAASWLLAGREPAALGRQPLD